MTGTSMAAPLVASAAALLRQMWPHLSGRQLAALLLETADRDIPGYAEHIHGQGLLDMERASVRSAPAVFPVAHPWIRHNCRLRRGERRRPQCRVARMALAHHVS